VRRSNRVTSVPIPYEASAYQAAKQHDADQCQVQNDLQDEVRGPPKRVRTSDYKHKDAAAHKVKGVEQKDKNGVSNNTLSHRSHFCNTLV
jgi:myo-inositol-1-phosphate synthase